MSKPSATIATDRSVIAGVELLTTGVWAGSVGGRRRYSTADLAAIVAASKHLPPPTIKLGHQDPRFNPGGEFDGSPNLGQVANLRLANRGHSLVGDLVNLPGWLADHIVTAYPQRSVELHFGLRDRGRTYRCVLTGVALLGQTWPAVTDLKSLQALLERK